MKHLEYYIIEALSKEQIDKLDSLIGDRDFDDAIKALNHYFKKKDTLSYSASRKEVINAIGKLSKGDNEKKRMSKITSILDNINKLKQNTRYNLINKLKERIENVYGEETFKSILKYIHLEGHDSKINNELSDFLDEHGLDRDYIKWGRYDPEEEFLDIFENSDKLQNLLDGKYEILVDDLIKHNGENLIDVFCSDFKDEAKELLKITYVKANGSSASVGAGEILLKCILKGGTTGKKGDVTIKQNNKEISIELKSGSQKNSGVPRGQQNAETLSFKDTIDKEVYNFFKEYYGGKDNFHKIQDSIFNENKKLSQLKPTSKNEHIGFFQTKECEILLRKLLKNDKELINKFIDVLAEGVKKQYHNTNIPEKIINSVKEYVNDNINFIDIVGFFETYCYKSIEKFDYLMIIDDNTSKYSIFNNNDLDDINNLLKYVHFNPVSSGNGRESAAKYKLN